MGAAAFERAIEQQLAAGVEQPAGALEQGSGTRPRRDVDQVAAQDEIRFRDRPGREADIQVERRRNIGEAGMGGPGGNALAAGRIGIGRLPACIGPQGRHMDDMLAGAAADLQRPGSLQQARQHDCGNRIAVARSGRGVAAPVGVHSRHAPVFPPRRTGNRLKRARRHDKPLGNVM